MILACGCELESGKTIRYCYVHEIQRIDDKLVHECVYELGYIIRYPSLTNTYGDEFIVSVCKSCGNAVKKRVTVDG